MNLRGQIVTVIDPSVRLGMGLRDITQDSRCVVLKTAAELQERESSQAFAQETVADHVGFLVDAIGDMVTADEKEIEPPPANIGAMDGKFMKGVVKMEGKIMVILKNNELLSINVR
jgi:purine-binding chemotaxis protein CheW